MQTRTRVGKHNVGKQAELGAGGARCQKTPMAVKIDKGHHGGGACGDYRLSPGTSWPKNNQEVAVSPPGTAASSTVIMAAAVVVGGLKIEISMRGSSRCSRLHWRTLAVAGK